MRDRRRFITAATGFGVLSVGGAWMAGLVRGQKMQEIKFDLGKNITATASTSGVPRFSTDNIDGYISYAVMPIPSEIAVRFARPNLEVVWQPVFSFAMQADEKRFADRRVESARMSLNSDFKTHAAAKAFVEQTIAQFRRGNWKRYQDPEWDTLLTGRSSLLDENGNISNAPMTIDPDYQISSFDWPVVAKNNPYWRWVGDGVLAVLNITFNERQGEQEPDYRMELEFELLDVKRQRDAENEARDLAEGDAKGWGSTARKESNKKDNAALNKRLEANAIKRGDAVVPNP